MSRWALYIRIYEWPRWWAQQIRRTAPNRTFRQAQSSALVPTPSTELRFCSCKISQDVAKCCKMCCFFEKAKEIKGAKLTYVRSCSLFAMTSWFLGLVFFYWSFWVLCCEEKETLLRINIIVINMIIPAASCLDILSLWKKWSKAWKAVWMGCRPMRVSNRWCKQVACCLRICTAPTWTSGKVQLISYFLVPGVASAHTASCHTCHSLVNLVIVIHNLTSDIGHAQFPLTRHEGMRPKHSDLTIFFESTLGPKM